MVCPKCGYSFKPRVPKPKKCPLCQKWINKPRTIKEGAWSNALKRLKAKRLVRFHSSIRHCGYYLTKRKDSPHA